MLEQETHYRRLTQEQLDNFTLDMNAAYARLKGMEEAIDSKTTLSSQYSLHYFHCVHAKLVKKDINPQVYAPLYSILIH